MTNLLIMMFFARERSAVQDSFMVLIVVYTEAVHLGTSNLPVRADEGKVF